MWKKIFNTNDKKENDFDDFDFGIESSGDEQATPIDENVIKKQNAINEKYVEDRAAEMSRRDEILEAYRDIIHHRCQPSGNDMQFFEIFKSARLARFRSLDLAVSHICDTFLEDRAYHYNYFKDHLLATENVELKIISDLCDIISRLTNNNDDEYEKLSAEKISAIKVLTIAIVDLSEGNI